MEETTLAYLRREGKTLFLYRNRKKDDVNAGKWIGVGGHIEPGETPEECVRREVAEETGFTVLNARRRGVVRFISDSWEEVMHLFTVDSFSGEMRECAEGELKWIPDERIPLLEKWEGDRVFLDLIASDAPFFRLTLRYEGDRLLSHETVFPETEGKDQ